MGLFLYILGFKSRLHPGQIFWRGVACITPAMDFENFENDSPLGQLSAYFDTVRSLPDFTHKLYCVMTCMLSHIWTWWWYYRKNRPHHTAVLQGCLPMQLGWVCEQGLLGLGPVSAGWQLGPLPPLVARSGWSVYKMCVWCCRQSRWWTNWSWNRTTTLLTENQPSLWCHQVLSLNFGLAWTTLTSRVVARMDVGCFQNDMLWMLVYSKLWDM